VSRGEGELLLGEWACLGVLYAQPTHGFAVAARLKPDGDVGRIWSLSRALTYRSLDQLMERELIRTAGEEPGLAGGNRTILAATRSGRSQFRRWVQSPVAHLRDVRSELLLKLVFAGEHGIDIADMLARQREHVQGLLDAHTARATEDPHIVERWRAESARAALRFLDHADVRSHSSG
jgi:DNA-binding PadR family transcriptional regulator